MLGVRRGDGLGEVGERHPVDAQVILVVRRLPAVRQRAPNVAPNARRSLGLPFGAVTHKICQLLATVPAVMDGEGVDGAAIGVMHAAFKVDAGSARPHVRVVVALGLVGGA